MRSHKNLGPIGLAVLTFIGYTQTDRQTSKVYIKILDVKYFFPYCAMLLRCESVLNRFSSFLKNFARKNIIKSANFFIFVLYCTKRRCSQIKPQLKVEIEDGREAP